MQGNPHNYEANWTIENHRDELIERLGKAIKRINELESHPLITGVREEEIRNAALEEAAVICDAGVCGADECVSEECNAVRGMAQDIRDLKRTPQGGEREQKL